MARSFRTAPVVGLTLFLAAASGGDEHLIALRHRVWQIGLQGQIAPFPYEFPGCCDETLSGSTAPSPSPDGRWIAFGRDFNIHLLNVSSRQEHQITWFGQQPRRGYTYAEVLIGAWSSDSRQIVLVVAPGETATEWGELLVPDAPYGFYVYNCATGTAQPVALPKTFQLKAWLPDGRFLGVIPGRRPYEGDKLVMFRPGDAEGAAIRAPTGSPTHVQVSADGEWLIGLLAGDAGQRGTTQIVKINLATMSVTPLVSLSSWTGNERPALSPRGEHISYLHTTGMVKGIPQQTLIVDQRPLYACHAPIDYRWVGGRTIAVACQDQVLLLDAVAGPP
jgi:hypothetical protein